MGLKTGAKRQLVDAAEIKKYEIFSQNILFFLLITLVIYYFCEFPKTEENNYEFEKIFRKRLSV